MTLATAWTVVLVALGLLLGALRQGRRRKYAVDPRPWTPQRATAYDQTGCTEPR